MQYCMNCGEEIHKQSSFCPVCNVVFTKENTISSAPRPTPVPKAKTDRKLLLGIGLSASVLLVLCVVALILLPEKGHIKSTDLTTPSESIDAQIFLEEEEISLIVGQQIQLEASTEGIDTKEEIRWTADDATMVRIDGNTLTALLPGQTTVTATVGGASAQCRIIVTDRRAETIQIDETASKTTYYVNDVLCDGDIALTVFYNNGDTETLTSGFDTQYDFSQAGQTALIVTYDEKSTSISVAVEEVVLDTLELVSAPTDTALMENETLDPTGLTLTAHYNNGTERTVTDGFTCTPSTFSSAGTHAVTISYGGKTAQFNVTVTALPRYTIFASSSNSSYGSVSLSETGPYPEGTTVTLTATPNTDCIFHRWSDGNTNASRTIAVSENASYEAIFYGPESGWVTSVPEGAMETAEKTQYRTKTEITTTSATAPEGYTLIEDYWDDPQYKTLEYVPSWRSGFSNTHALYSRYHNTPVSDSTTTSQKVVVTSDTHVGYLYWHWCRGENQANGPLNRCTDENPGQKAFTNGDPLDAFHAYFSTVSPQYSGPTTPEGRPNPMPDASYHHPNADCCKDSYWYYYMDVRCQEYTVYTSHKYVYEGWTQWQDTEPSGTPQSRVVYCYRPA